MAFYLKSTAYTRLFKMIDSTDHISKKTGLTCTVNLSKAGAAFGAAGGTITEVANGWYKIALTTTDTNTAGDLAVYITATGADDTDFCDQIVDPTAANLGVNVVNWNNTVVATPATAGIPDVNVKNINNAAAATPGASGGLLISGSNSGTTTLGALTVTGNMTLSDGLLISRSTSNASAITATGNGTGHGIVATSGSGATGDGIQATAASTNGRGLKLLGNGSGDGLLINGGATGNGINVAAGGTSGDAITASATSGNGITANGGTNGSGFSVTGAGSGHGLKATGGNSGGASSMFLTGGNAGLNIAPSNGIGISVAGAAGAVGVAFTGGSAAAGFRVVGGSTSGNGFEAVGTGSGNGVNFNAGATGTGWSIAGGGTSGDAVVIASTSGHGVNIAATGSSKHGVTITGGNGGTSDGLKCVAGTGGVDIRGNITGSITGSLSGSAGSVTGAVGSVTGAVGSVTGAVGSVTGAVGSIAASGIARASFATDTGLQSLRSSTAQAGGSTSITLDASASAVTDFYKNALILITSGTGVGQGRFCTAYNGGTKVATVTAWATNPDNTSVFAILAFDAIVGATAPTAAQNATAVWQDLLAGSDFGTASSIGALLKADIDAAISSRSTFAGGAVASVTGNVGGNVVGSVASVTARVTANTDQLAGQTVTAAAGVTFPTSVASPTNITAGTITTTTNLTTNNDKTGYGLSAAAVQAIWDALTSALTTVGSIGKRIADFLTGDAYVRLGAPAGASHAADVAAVKVDTAAVKVQTDKLTFTVANQIDANVLDWKSATAPAMTGDAFARLGAPAGASVSADVAAVKSDTAAIKTSTNTGVAPGAASGLALVGSAMTLTTGERTSIADAHLDRADAIETGLTPRQAHRLEAAAAAGKLSGAATSSVVIRNAIADSKDRITATVDANGNRSAVTTDVS